VCMCVYKCVYVCLYVFVCVCVGRVMCLEGVCVCVCMSVSKLYTQGVQCDRWIYKYVGQWFCSAEIYTPFHTPISLFTHPPMSSFPGLEKSLL
jgi:hypothetical protein